MALNVKNADAYPTLDTYTAPLKKMEREIIGREKEMRSIRAAMMRPELCNVILLADAGAGKTSIVQGLQLRDNERLYLEVDLARMISGLNNEKEMAGRIKALFDEAAAFIKAEGKELVLFMDEFHQVVQLSEAAVEALKPMLADSGTRGIRVIAATTYIEFRKWIAPNQPLVERLQRFNLQEPSRETVIQILKGMANTYGVASQFYNDELYNAIYEYTNRYIPANSQPRKSILILDSMVGWYRAEGRALNKDLLAEVIYEQEGVKVAVTVDALSIKARLDEKVFAQELATSTIEQRLQICVADLQNKTKPMSSFLFCGSTGTGKQVVDSEPIAVMDPEGRLRMSTHGELRAGDLVFDREGNPTIVKQVFPQGNCYAYEVTLSDGRVLRVGRKHLWTYRSAYGNGSLKWKTASTEELMEKLSKDGRKNRYVIPMNGAVQWPAVDEDEQAYLPYELGSLIGKGSVHGFGDYAGGSIQQRWDLVRGIFDRIGTIQTAGGRYTLECRFPETSMLQGSLRTLLFTLGIQSRERKSGDDIVLHVMCSGKDKDKFFSQHTHFNKWRIAHEAARYDTGRKYGESVGIAGIRKTDETAEMSCIMVENPEHVYQAGADCVVTHNTEITKQLADILFGSEHAMIRFDMTEYALDESFSRFKSELTARVWARPYAIILLDEIEKACSTVTRLLLQVLDDGRLLDDNNREVSFLNSYIVMTTNAGAEAFKTIAQYNSDDRGSGKELMKYQKLIRRAITQTTGDNRFPPELLGRIDCIVPFQPLSRKTMELITKKKIADLQERIFKSSGVKVAIHKDVIKYLIEDKADTNSDAGGARAVVSTLESDVVSAVARFLNMNKGVRKIIVSVGGEMRANNEFRLESSAYIDVKAG